MLLGYNTNGFAHHRVDDAIEILAEIGYQSVALTIDHGVLCPATAGSVEATPAVDWPLQLEAIGKRLNALGMRCVIETGARYLLNPRVKHEPTLVSPCPDDRAVRQAFLRHCIDVAAALDAECVSLWSGALQDEVADNPLVEAEVWDRLTSELDSVLAYAEQRGVTLGFEPEPGMFIDTMARFDELSDRVNHPRFQLTLDVGHLHCLGEGPIDDVVRRYAGRIVNVHLEDMRAGTHEHLMFGDGQMDFRPIIKAFSDIGYTGGLHVELSRHSHAAPQVAQASFEFLRPLVQTVDCQSQGSSGERPA